MIVADTNIIGYLFLNSQWTDQAVQALRKDPNWAAPFLWRSEFRNVLSLYVRRQILKLEDSQRVMAVAIRLMQNHEYEVPSDQVLNLAAFSGCSAYDCEFVVVAKNLNIKMITVDKQILKQFPETALSLEQFISS